MSVIEKKSYKIVDCGKLVLLRFKNDLGGRDLVGFFGRPGVEFSAEITETQTRDVSDFTPTSIERGREQVVKTRGQEKFVVSRHFASANREGLKQLFTSLYVEIYTGVKNDTAANKINKWLEVQISLINWVEKKDENLIYIVAEIIMPERFTA